MFGDAIRMLSSSYKGSTTDGSAKEPLDAPSNTAKLRVSCPAGNTVLIDKLAEGKGSISVVGSGNKIEFGVDSKFNGTLEVRGKNNRVFVGNNSVVRGKIVVKGNDQTVSVGEFTTFQSCYLLCDENCDIRIGRWCMLSRDIEIRTTDAHSVVDSCSGVRLNKPESVLIGDHVWIGVGALISKGVAISDDSIIGAHSFVNGVFTESQVIIAGAPAKVVKRGVTWHRSRKEKFTDEELSIWRSAPQADDGPSVE